MKVCNSPAFWPLGPRAAAHGLELGCWLAAALLAVALALLPAPNTGAAVAAVRATVVPPAPHLVIYRQHCIERILARAAGETEEYVVYQIHRLCDAPPTKPSTAGFTLLSCERPFTVRLTPAAKPVAGCLGG